MYILIEKEPFKVLTFEAKNDLSTYIGVHVNTITYRFSKKPYWDTEKGVVYKSDEHKKRNRGGNSDSIDTKIAKRDGIIPCKHS